MAIASKALTLAFVLSASDKMSRVVDQAIKKSSQSLSSFERKYGQVGGNMMKFGGKLLAASTTVGGAIIGMAKSTADYGNTAAKTARSVGMDAEEFQKLSYAAKYAGVDQQKLSASMVRLNKNIVAAAGGSKAAQQTFKDLGINLKDSAGNLRAPNEILADIADVFSSTEDGAGKTALAYELLGRSGADMISLLNGGSAGLKTMGAEAERMGLVISNDAAHASEDFCDNLDRVTDSIRGVVFQMGAAMMPAINNTAIKIKEVITKVTEWLRENPKLASTIGTIGLVLTGLLAVVGLASVVFGSLIFVIGKFAGAFRAATSAIKVGQAIIMACKNSMLLFRIQYAAFVVWSKLAAVGQWLFNSALFACPITWIIAGIMAVVAAVVLMVKYWDNIAVFFKKIWNAVVGVFKKAWSGIKNIFLNYTPHGLIIQHWGKISSWFSILWGKVRNGIGMAWNAIKNIFLNYTPHGLIIQHWGKISSWFSILWGKVRNGIGTAWNAIKNIFLNYTPHGLIIQHWDTITGWFTGLWENIKAHIAAAWDGIKNLFSALNPVEWIASAWEYVGEFFGNLGIRFYEWGKNILQGLWNGITDMIPNVVEGMKGIGLKIAKGFKAILGINSPSRLFAQYGVNITQGVVVGMSQGGAAVENASESLAADTTSGINRSMQSSVVDASNTFNGGNNSGATVNYSPQITITGNVSPDVRDEFSKMLRQHANEILSIIRRDAENSARLSFN